MSSYSFFERFRFRDYNYHARSKPSMKDLRKFFFDSYNKLDKSRVCRKRIIDSPCQEEPKNVPVVNLNAAIAVNGSTNFASKNFVFKYGLTDYLISLGGRFLVSQEIPFMKSQSRLFGMKDFINRV